MKKTEKNFTTEKNNIFDEDMELNEDMSNEEDISVEEEDSFDGDISTMDEDSFEEDIFDEAEEEYATTYNRKNVDGIKKILLMMMLIMCAVPILFCLYLLVKMNGIERKVDMILERQLAKSNQSVAKVEEATSEYSNLDKELLDKAAYKDLDKNTESSNHNLAAPKYNNVTGEITVIEEPKLNGKRVYLTFDDGPSQYTGEILDILDQNDVKGTFFVVKSENPEYWQYYTDIVERGHTLAMHSFSHVYEEIYADKEAFVKDVESIHNFLYDETGVDCRFYRFPGGSSNSVSEVDISELIEYLDSKGITYFDWNALSGDAVDDSLTADELNDSVLEYVRSNESDSIVLLHDLDYKHETVDGLDSLIKTLKEEGYQILPIDMSTDPVQHFSE